MRFSIKWFIAASLTCMAYSSDLRAQASCPADISGRILQNGYSVLTCLPGVPGSGLNDTLAVKDMRSYGTRYANPAERWPTDQNPNTPTIQTWAPTDFDIGGIGPQNVFSVAISPDDGDMYTASTRLWGEPAAPGSIGALLTPGPLGVYRINGTTGAVTLIVNITADVNANENFGASYITYDENTDQVFTVGMDTGTIYRVDPNGSGGTAVLQSYNPDIDGVVPEDTIASELVPLGERILGLAWNPGDNRLYYSVWVVDTAIENNALPNTAQNVIRSVALDGSNAIDPSTDRLEIAMPFIDVVQEDNLNPPANVTRMANYSNPVADIEFNHDGTRVLLSETGYDSSFPASWAHRSRLLEYTFNGTNWVIAGNQSKYGIGESFFFDPGAPNPPIQYEGINARGGAAWAYGSITPPQAVGRDDFLLATGDALILRADLFYGYQFMPTTGPGNVYNSLVADLDGNPLDFAKGLFGDVDVFMCAFDIGNRVWIDSNANGIQDGPETGVPNVQVTLHTGTNCANSTGISVSTNPSGNYNIPDILPGQYSLQFSNLPAGAVVTQANQGGDDALDSDANASACIADYTLTTSDDSLDMGIFFPVDYGDNLDTYGTLMSSAGAVHNLSNTLYLGACVDSESNGQPSALSDADDGNVGTVTFGTCATAGDDEDGVTNFSTLVPGQNATVDVTSTGACVLDAWIDFNQNGNYSDPGEQIFTGTTLVNGANTGLVFAVPGAAMSGTTSSRFRCSGTGGLGPTGSAADGEVEDYVVTLVNFSLGDFVWFDTNQDGIQDVGEPGVNGVDVALYDNATCTGAAVDNTTTATGGVPAADGFYEFTGLAPATYCVEFTSIPAGYVISPANQGGDDTADSDADASGLIQNINLTADDPDEDMGISLDGSIAGLTWCESDTNANTTYDAGDGDTLLPNIQVTLYTDANCSNTIDGTDAGTAVTQDTNGTGDYLFANLPVGPSGAPLCYLTEVDTADTDLGVCDTPITATLLGPDLDTVTPDSIGNDFGFEENITLGDFVWFDTNQDGIQDVGEPGVNGIDVALYDNATCTGAAVANTVTATGGLPAADGFYQFPNLSTGTYCVEFTSIPAGYVISPANQGGDDTADSDADASGLIQNINLTANDPNEDMGISLDGSIAGITWCESDTNANTTYDAGDGDTLLPNIQVTLYTDANCSDTIDGTDAGSAVSQDTDGTGAYLFSGLPVGPSGAPLCYLTEVNQADTDLALCNTPITATLLGPDLDTDTPDSIGNDFGFEENITLGDFVWFDTNQDGIQDVGEPGVNGIDVALYDNATCTGAAVANTVTATGGLPAADGFYQFPNLSTGTYCVEFTSIPAGYVISPANQGGDDTADSDADASGLIQNINLTANDPNEDMGISLDGSIAGITWCESDTNANTTYDAGDGDTLLPNIQVTLYTDANCSDSVDGADAASAITQDTNAAAAYLFDDLPVGPSGSPVCYITEVDINDTDLGVCDTAITATLLPPDLDTDTPDSIGNDFGFNETLALGDYLWYDNNQNGQQDAGEPGVNGVDVALYNNATCSGASIDTTVTANGGNPLRDGYYQFTGLSSGDYCVAFSNLPTGYVFTVQNQGDDATDSDADTVTGQITNIILSQNDFSFDAGVYAAIGQVQGSLFCDDLVPNGLQDANEAIAGVSVEILRDNSCDGGGDVVIDTLDTDANGEFSFDNLPVALAPAPPNPRVCYVVRFDTADPELLSCVTPITPIDPQVEVTTDDPQPPNVIFGVITGRPPVMVPVNSWWALMLLVLVAAGMARYQLAARRPE